MRAPVWFYDTTPIGRILNRFTKDIADVDQMVPPTLSTYFTFIIINHSVILLICCFVFLFIYT